MGMSLRHRFTKLLHRLWLCPRRRARDSPGWPVSGMASVRTASGGRVIGLGRTNVISLRADSAGKALSFVARPLFCRPQLARSTVSGLVFFPPTRRQERDLESRLPACTLLI